jgi:hypothetical protein
MSLPISLTSLAQSGTDPHKFLLITQQIVAATTDNLEILDYLWTPSLSFCRAYSVDISSLYTPNLGAASIHGVPPWSLNLGEVMLKVSYKPLFWYNIVERVVLTNQGTKVLLVGLISQ